MGWVAVAIGWAGIAMIGGGSYAFVYSHLSGPVAALVVVGGVAGLGFSSWLLHYAATHGMLN